MVHTKLNKYSSKFAEFVIFENGKPCGTYYYTKNHGEKLIGKIPMELKKEDLISTAQLVMKTEISDKKEKKEKK